jgi:hypothetical protein
MRLQENVSRETIMKHFAAVHQNVSRETFRVAHLGCAIPTRGVLRRALIFSSCSEQKFWFAFALSERSEFLQTLQNLRARL